MPMNRWCRIPVVSPAGGLLTAPLGAPISKSFYANPTNAFCDPAELLLRSSIQISDKWSATMRMLVLVMSIGGLLSQGVAIADDAPRLAALSTSTNAVSTDAAPTPSANGSNAEDRGELEEVTVTATRRSDIPFDLMLKVTKTII